MTRARLLWFVAWTIGLSTPPLQSQAAAPPVAAVREHQSEFHGIKLVDPYYWLREKTSPEVVQYLEAENAYTQAMTEGQAAFRNKLYQEMLARVQQTDLSVPVRDGQWFSYSRTVEGKQYPLYCRKRATADGQWDESATEVVLLDQNQMAAGKKYLGIGAREVSDDDRWLAFSTDESGFRQYRLHLKDLSSGEVRAGLADRVTAVQWAADHKTLFYVTEDAVTKRSHQLWRRAIDGEPELIFEEKDELFAIRLTRTKDKQYLQVVSTSSDTWETRLLAASTPDATFQPVIPREKGHKYTVEHRHGRLYIRTNRNAKNFRVVSTKVETPSEAHWEELIPHRSEVLIGRFEVFQDYAVSTETSEARDRFRILDFKTGQFREITFPEDVYAAFGAGTPDFQSPTYRISYQSMVTPACVFDYDFATLERKLLKQQAVLGGFDSSKYRTLRLWAPARDGKKIPISLVYRMGADSKEKSPLWLYGYGSYGSGIPATFSSSRISLLDRGVVFAIAHVRGGNEMGETWHDEGKLQAKMNTFTDFIDAAEHLAAVGWADRQRILIEGGSAGGLLVGAATNLRPDLFRAVHAAVPFMDVINTMTDPTLPLTVGEYLEWGNPNEKPAFQTMLSYSPYDNLAKKDYPSILVTTSFNDSQVMYWEPAKYVAKLRSLKTDRNPLHLKIKMEPAGHGGASGRYDRMRDEAFVYAWMLDQVGIRE